MPHMLMRMVSHLAQSCALLLFLVSLVQRSPAQFVEISAEIELTSYPSRQTNAEATAKPTIISVVCITGPNLWRIDNDRSKDGEHRWLFDGTNVYESLLVASVPPHEVQDVEKKAGGMATVSSGTASSNLTINIWPSLDGQPLGDEAVNIPWLAFCSGTYLKRKGRLIPLLCDAPRDAPDRYGYSDRTETFHDTLGLPRSVDLFLSKSLYQSSAKNYYKGWSGGNNSPHAGWMNRGVKNLPEGLLTFHYSATATTNFLTWTFPLRFEFFQKGRDFVETGDWFKRGVGTLKSIRAATEPKNLFDPRMHQVIVDRRFQDKATGVEAHIYAWTNGFTPQTQDPVLQKEFKARIEQAARSKAASK
jgi:hypothetical protein